MAGLLIVRVAVITPPCLATSSVCVLLFRILSLSIQLRKSVDAYKRLMYLAFLDWRTWVRNYSPAPEVQPALVRISEFERFWRYELRMHMQHVRMHALSLAFTEDAPALPASPSKDIATQPENHGSF